MVSGLLGTLGRLVRHRLFQVLVSLAIGAALLWLAIARIDLAGLGAELAQVRPGWLMAAVALYWVALMLRSWRWRILLAPVRSLSFGQVFHGLLVGYAANYLLPARLGELVRADFLGRRYGISRLSVVGTIVVERLFDVVVFIGFIFAGLAALHSTADSRIGPILHLVELVAVGCIVLAILLLILVRLRHKPLPRSVAFLEKRLRALAAGLHLITGGQEVALLVAATAIVWTADTVTFWVMTQALNQELSFLQLLLVMGMSCLASLIPAAPGNIGALQYALVLAFQLLGLPGVTGFSLATLFQGCCIASSTLVGGGLYFLAALGSARTRPKVAEPPVP